MLFLSLFVYVDDKAYWQQVLYWLLIVATMMGKAGRTEGFKCKQQGWKDGWGHQTSTQVREATFY